LPSTPHRPETEPEAAPAAEPAPTPAAEREPAAAAEREPAPAAASAPANGRGPLQGVGRAFAVLELLAERPRSPSELSRALGMKWTTAYRTVMSLKEMGYVERDPETGRYAVGVRAYSLGSAYIASQTLPQLAKPYLHAASATSGATAQLVKRDHRNSVVISVYESQTNYVPETTVGHNFPLHCGSKGRVLLAYAEPAFIDAYLSRELEALTQLTMTDPVALRERMAIIRARGYEITDRDIRLFSSSVAAPVTDASGTVVASVTLAVQPHELRKQSQRLVELVTRTAKGISRAMLESARPDAPRA
jgi:DNA-binding IclR family transcriptional regulator